MTRKIRNSNFLISLIFISSLLMFASCKTSRVLSGSYKSLSPKQIISLHNENLIQPEILSVKFAAELTNNESKQSANAYVRIYKDSLIWLSVRSMSIEGIRAVLTTDSIRFVDRLNKLFWVGDYNMFSSKFHVDIKYQQIQDILYQRMIDYQEVDSKTLMPCNDSISYCLFSPAAGISNYDTLVSAFSPLVVEQYYKFYPSDFSLFAQSLRSTLSNDILEIKYGTTQQYEEYSYPERILFTLKGNNIIQIKLQTQSYSANKIVKTPFKISEKYQEIKF